jgi:hypothetical protein
VSTAPQRQVVTLLHLMGDATGPDNGHQVAVRGTESLMGIPAGEYAAPDE